MSALTGFFAGTVKQMDKDGATILIEKLHKDAKNVAVGDEVRAMRADFMRQMPGPSTGAWVEGNVEHDPATGQNRFIHIVRPV